MANKPSPKITPHQVRVSAQGSPRPVVNVRYESGPVPLAAGEPLNVEGNSVIVVYNESGNAAVASAKSSPGATALAMLTAEATAVSVADDRAMPVSVVGVPYIQFDQAVIVIAAG